MEKEKSVKSKYTKEQIIKSAKFSTYNKDVLMAILKNDCLYAIKEVEDIVKEFLGRKV